MVDTQAVAQQFITSYYQSFDANRSTLASLYRQESTLIFEGQSFQGTEAIVKKLVELPFQVVQHGVTTFDASLTLDGGLLVFVVGQLKTDSDPAHSFSQCFLLKQVGDSLFVMNDIFRLILHHQ